MTLRDKVLYILESRKGEYVSGQEIAESTSVSRSAVAKCVSSLKDEGFKIKSVNNLGHSLDIDNDILSEAGILANITDKNTEVRVFKSIDSTNTEAKRAVSNGLEGDAIFAAEEQTAGRGRRGKSFYSPDSGGLYFSCVLHPNVGLADSTALTAAAAVAVCEAIAHTTKKHPQIKWVNDIFTDGCKVCGILTEAVSDFESGAVQAVIIGIGINLTTDHFPDELKGIAASLGTPADRCKIAAMIFDRLQMLCYALPDRSFMDDYRKYSLVLGKTVSFTRNGIDYLATAKEIFDDGGLLVITESGEETVLNSGEISIKL